MLTAALSAVALAGWLAFNWLAPLATIRDDRAERMSSGRVPAGIFDAGRALRADFYLSNLVRGPGFSAWVWPRHIVVLDRAFLSHLTPEHIRFVMAHELGHVALGHLKTRWLFVVSGAILLPAARRRLRTHEEEADEYATRLTGFRREFFDRPIGGVANDQVRVGKGKAV